VTPEEYVQSARETSDRYAEQINVIFREAHSHRDAGDSEGMLAPWAKASAESEHLFVAFGEEFAALVPPEQFRADHERVVASLPEGLQMQRRLRRLAEAGDLEGFKAANEEQQTDAVTLADSLSPEYFELMKFMLFAGYEDP
jgi:hypothetical protein